MKVSFMNNVTKCNMRCLLLIRSVCLLKCIIMSVSSQLQHMHISGPTGKAQLTLLTVTEVTVVPAVWLMVLGVIPEAPTELWEDRHFHHKLFLRLLKMFKYKSSQESTDLRVVQNKLTKPKRGLC